LHHYAKIIKTHRFYGLLTITQILVTIKTKKFPGRPQQIFHVTFRMASLSV